VTGLECQATIAFSGGIGAVLLRESGTGQGFPEPRTGNNLEEAVRTKRSRISWWWSHSLHSGSCLTAATLEGGDGRDNRWDFRGEGRELAMISLSSWEYILSTGNGHDVVIR